MTFAGPAAGPFGVALGAALVLLGAALLVALARLARGPSLPDRVVALELAATLSAGIIVVYAVASQQPVLLDVAIVIALLGFLGAVAFARYVEQGAPSAPPGLPVASGAEAWAGREAPDASDPDGEGRLPEGVGR